MESTRRDPDRIFVPILGRAFRSGLRGVAAVLYYVMAALEGVFAGLMGFLSFVLLLVCAFWWLRGSRHFSFGTAIAMSVGCFVLAVVYSGVKDRLRAAMREPTR